MLSQFKNDLNFFYLDFITFELFFMPLLLVYGHAREVRACEDREELARVGFLLWHVTNSSCQVWQQEHVPTKPTLWP